MAIETGTGEAGPGSWRAIHLWAGGAQRTELKAVHLRMKRHNDSRSKPRTGIEGMLL
ncbi:hypothetical protein [Arthrobacter sp. H20]|uniref:hypothetical protein n=1 Tax=Arthrobacter sp. H20 TaxID=1267981 RepID=UPI0004B5000E|nr:hypothetical protein [Arthrobacter sp. H20]